MDPSFGPIPTQQGGEQWEALHSVIRNLGRDPQLRPSRNRIQPLVTQRLPVPNSAIFQAAQGVQQTDFTVRRALVFGSASVPGRARMNVIQVVVVGAVVLSASGLVLASSDDTQFWIVRLVVGPSPLHRLVIGLVIFTLAV